MNSNFIPYKKLSTVICAVLTLFSISLSAQNAVQREEISKLTNVSKVMSLATEFSKEHKLTQSQLLSKAQKNGWAITEKLPNGNIAQLQDVGADGTPLYYTSFSDVVSKSTRANALQDNGDLDLGLNGEGMLVGVWDGGSALLNHQEFGSRVSVADEADTVDKHATMVMGTLIASGVNQKATGVAYKATAISSDWSKDKAEVAAAAANGLLVSNHSYGIKSDRVPDWYFGSYTKVAQDWDKIMYNAPYYVMVTASGNSRNSDDNDAPISGKTADGFDLILGFAAAKNGITVSAAESDFDNEGNILEAEVANYSSFGPMDDSRIKPDLSGAGTNVFATSSSGTKNYETSSGTSLATPGVSGSMLLLQQYYSQLNKSYMRGATLKGLVLHTADDVQQPGPDYKMGWGVMNAKTAAEVITRREYSTIITEEELANGETYTLKVTANGSEVLRTSISWTDPATGFVNTGTLNDVTAALVNDLDVRITKDGETFFPWKLSAANASKAATKGDNKVDPFEKIEIDNAYGEYTITVSHKGTLTTGSQKFSLIVTGVQLMECSITTPTEVAIEEASFTGVAMNWSASAEALFEVQYKKESDEEWTVDYTLESTFDVSGLQLNEAYEFRVRAFCTERVASEFSEIETFTFLGEETILDSEEVIEEVATKSVAISVYPNPAVDQINIEGEVQENAAFHIVTTTGMMVKAGNAKSTSISVSDLSAGLYILSVQDKGEVKSTKFYKH